MWELTSFTRVRRGRDRMVVRFTTTYTVSAFHDKSCSWRGVLEITLCDFSDLRLVGGFLCVLWFPPPINLHDITEILLKVALNTISLSSNCIQINQSICLFFHGQISDRQTVKSCNNLLQTYWRLETWHVETSYY